MPKIVHHRSGGALTTAIHIAVVPSRWLIAAVVAVHLATLALVAVIDIAPIYRVVIAAGVLSSLWLALQSRRDAHTLPRRLQMTADGELSVVWSDGAVMPVVLLQPVLVLPWLIVLRVLARDGPRHTFVLFPDSASPTSLRRLRVRLLAGAAGP